MSKKKKTKKSIKRIFLLGITSVTIIIGTTYTIGKYWIEIFDKYQEKKELKTKLSNLKEKEAALQVDANKLQDPDYIARYAREKYSYSKEGEMFYEKFKRYDINFCNSLYCCSFSSFSNARNTNGSFFK